MYKRTRDLEEQGPDGTVRNFRALKFVDRRF